LDAVLRELRYQHVIAEKMIEARREQQLFVAGVHKLQIAVVGKQGLSKGCSVGVDRLEAASPGHTNDTSRYLSA